MGDMSAVRYLLPGSLNGLSALLLAAVYWSLKGTFPRQSGSCAWIGLGWALLGVLSLRDTLLAVQPLVEVPLVFISFLAGASTASTAYGALGLGFGEPLLGTSIRKATVACVVVALAGLGNLSSTFGMVMAVVSSAGSLMLLGVALWRAVDVLPGVSRVAQIVLTSSLIGYGLLNGLSVVSVLKLRTSPVWSPALALFVMAVGAKLIHLLGLTVFSLDRSRYALQMEMRASEVDRTAKYVAQIAHDLATPLAELGLRVRSVAEAPMPERAAQALGRVRNLASELMDIAGGALILMSRGGTANYIEESSDVNVNAALRAAAMSVKATRQVPIKIVWELERDVFVEAQPQRLAGVFKNLLLNAVEAYGTSEGARTDSSIVVATRRVRRGESNLAEITVRDGAGGMPDDLRRSAFEPGVSTKGSSRGLGLAIARAAVEDLGGSIELLSVPGGTNVLISLPRSGLKSAFRGKANE